MVGEEFGKTADRISGQTEGKVPTSGVATLYRGTPGPEPTPKPLAFAAVFFSIDPKAARQYGSHITEYQIPMDWLHILAIDSPEAMPLAKEYMVIEGWDKEGPISDDFADDYMTNYFMFPEKGWVRFLANKGFVGTSIGGDLALFGQGLKWLKKAEPKSASALNNVEFIEKDITAEESSYENTPAPGVAILARVDHQNIGALEIYFLNGNAYVRGIVVDPQYQHLGVAQDLYDRGIALASKRGLKYFYSDQANAMSDDAQRAWRRLKTRYKVEFEPSEDGYDSIGRKRIDLSKTASATTEEFPLAGSMVDGLTVGDDIANMSSIGASMYDYEIEDGIREVPMSFFNVEPRQNFYAKNDLDRCEALAEEIKASGRINPLIVGVDKEGPWVLEGGHRLVALHLLGKKALPALVVKDLSDEWIAQRGGKTAASSSGTFRLYHGSANEFEDFELGHRNGWSIPRDGLYFTDDLPAAKEFGHRIIVADVTMNNPLDLRNEYGKNSDFERVFALLPPDYQKNIEDGPYSGLIPNTVKTGLAQTEEFIKAAKDSGFDGIIMQDSIGHQGFDSYIAFSPSQVKIVNEKTAASTNDFLTWFADSKVVDESGRPLKVFHGTNADFKEFSEEMLGRHTNAATSALGFFFTDKPGVASGFGKAVMPVYLRIKKPFDPEMLTTTPKQTKIYVDRNGSPTRNTGEQPYTQYERGEDPFNKLKEAVFLFLTKNTKFENLPIESTRTMTLEHFSEARKRLIALGFDGIIVRKTQMDGTGKYGREHDFYIVFSPTQIKSAIGNSGQYGDTADITASKTAAPLYDGAKETKFYHGTGEEKSAQGIIQNGIQPRSILMGAKPQPTKQYAPVHDRVYLTPSLGYAAVVAVGGQVFGQPDLADQFLNGAEVNGEHPYKKDPYGYIFEVSGSDLAGDVVPDEDSIGETLSYFQGYRESRDKLGELRIKVKQGIPLNKYWEDQLRRLEQHLSYDDQPINQPDVPDDVRYEVWNLINRRLTDKQKFALNHHNDFGELTVIGKKLQRYVSPAFTQWLLEHGGHIAHQGLVWPSKAWRLDKRKAIETGNIKESMEEIPLQHHKAACWVLTAAGPEIAEQGQELEPWRKKKNEYSPYPKIIKNENNEDVFEDETDDQRRERYRKGQDWDQATLAAISLGKLTHDQAYELGSNEVPRGDWHSGPAFKPLPQTLYHVTTHLGEVKANGLKTRHELAMDSGHGLGGGTDMAISFTADLGIAKDIYSAIIEAIRVLTGRLTVEQMLDMAYKGTGAKQPWIEHAVQWGGTYFVSNKWQPGEPYPTYFQAFLDRKQIDSEYGHGKTLEEMPPGSEPVGDGWTGGDGKQRYITFRVPMDEKRYRDMRFDWFKTWLYAREEAGGPMNPLFFSTDINALSQIPESEIAILQFKPVPGAMGTQLSALGEWRTYTGKAVELVGIVPPGEAKTAAIGGPQFPPFDQWEWEGKKSWEKPGTYYGRPGGTIQRNLKDDYEKITAMYSAWKYPVTVWRAVKLRDISDLREDNVGSSWSHSISGAVPYWGRNAPGDIYFLEGQIPSDSIDWEETLNRALYLPFQHLDSEKEICVKEGAPIYVKEAYWGYTSTVGRTEEPRIIPLNKTMTASKTATAKQAWQDERFSYWGLQFAIDKAEEIIAASPRPAQKAPKNFLEAFVGTVDDDKAAESGRINLLTVGLNKEHLQQVDIEKPGIVAPLTFKPNKEHPEAQSHYILIDGNHRAKKRLQMGLDFMEVYPLTPEEAWKCMAPYTFPGLLKNYVNPTKKVRKRTASLQGTILYLDDMRRPLIPNAVQVRSYDEFVDYLKTNPVPDAFSLDHDLSLEHYPTIAEEEVRYNTRDIDYGKYKTPTGLEAVKYLISNKVPVKRWFVHSYNDVGAEKMEALLHDYAPDGYDPSLQGIPHENEEEEVYEGQVKGGFQQPKTAGIPVSDLTYLHPPDPTDNPAFKAWFRNSVVKDYRGDPLPVYHGSTHEFESFDAKTSDPENHYGQGMYFTDSEADVTKNYATPTGPDITNRIERLTEKYLSELQDELGEDFPSYNSTEWDDLRADANERAIKELTGSEEGLVYLTYLRIEKPVYVSRNNQDSTWFEINYNEATGRESGSGMRLYRSVLKTGQQFGVDGYEVWEKLQANGRLTDSFTAYQFEQEFRGCEDLPEEIYVQSGNYIAQVYRNMGFDGIIQMEAAKQFQNMGIPTGTRHYIVWNPRQVKSALKNKGTFNPRSPRMTASAKPFIPKTAKLKWELEDNKYGPFTLTTAYEWHEYGDEVDMEEEGAWNLLVVIAHQGEEYAGNAEFILRNGGLLANNVSVIKKFQRQGLATAMYAYAEKRTGLTTHPHNIQTTEGRALWAQPDRKFGAGETLKEEQWSKPLYHATTAYKAGKIKKTQNFDSDNSGGYNQMGRGIYTHPSMNRVTPWAVGPVKGAFLELHFTKPLRLAIKNEEMPDQRTLIDQGFDGIYDKHAVTEIPHQVLLFNQKSITPEGTGSRHGNALIDWPKVRIVPYDEKVHGYLKGFDNPEDRPFYQGAPREAGRKAVELPSAASLKFYHGLPRKYMSSVFAYGLLREKDQSSVEWGPSVYLASDPNTAADYTGSHEGDYDWVILEVDGSKLEENYLLPDDFEFREEWAELDPKDPLKRKYGQNWANCPWQVSYQLSRQVAYNHDIPPEAITWHPKSYETMKKKAGKRVDGGWVTTKGKVLRFERREGSKPYGHHEMAIEYRLGRDKFDALVKGNVRWVIQPPEWFGIEAAQDSQDSRALGLTALGECPAGYQVIIDFHDAGSSQFGSKEEAARFLRQAPRTTLRPPAMTAAKQQMLPGFQQDIAQTPQFQAWFGDSEVVDKQGRPLVVYHGTRCNFDAFDHDGRGTIHFTTDPKFAGMYSGAMGWSQKSKKPIFNRGKKDLPIGANIMPCYLKCEQLFDFRRREDQAVAAECFDDAQLDQWDLKRAAADYYEILEEELTDEQYDRYDSDCFRSQVAKGSWVCLELGGFIGYIREQGYDGITMMECGSLNYAVFHPNQVKSAIGNTGDFDPDSTSITASISEAMVRGWITSSGQYIPVPLDKSHATVAFEEGLAKRKDQYGGAMDEAIRKGNIRVGNSAEEAEYTGLRFDPGDGLEEYTVQRLTPKLCDFIIRHLVNLPSNAARRFRIQFEGEIPPGLSLRPGNFDIALGAPKQVLVDALRAWQTRKSAVLAAADKEWAKWIGVDLDGTLAKEMEEFDPLKIGEPIEGMVRKVKEAVEDGVEVRVFTARMADEEKREDIRKAIREWTLEHVGTALESTHEKDPGMTEIWDDRARQVVKDEGKFASKRQPRSEYHQPIPEDLSVGNGWLTSDGYYIPVVKPLGHCQAAERAGLTTLPTHPTGQAAIDDAVQNGHVRFMNNHPLMDADENMTVFHAKDTPATRHIIEKAMEHLPFGRKVGISLGRKYWEGTCDDSLSTIISGHSVYASKFPTPEGVSYKISKEPGPYPTFAVNAYLDGNQVGGLTFAAINSYTKNNEERYEYTQEKGTVRVMNVWVKTELKYHGIGIILYRMAMEEARRRGYKRFKEGFTQSRDASNVWERLAKDFTVVEDEKGVKHIDLVPVGKAASAVEVPLYHITYKSRVPGILREGIRPDRVEESNFPFEGNGDKVFLTSAEGIGFWKDMFQMMISNTGLRQEVAVLQVSPEGLKLKPDIDGTSDAGAPAYWTWTVPPKNITLMEKTATTYGPLWHGTPNRFEVFRTRRRPSPLSAQSHSMGAYFTDDPAVAHRFAFGPNADIKRVSLEMVKPLDLRSIGNDYKKVPEMLPWLPDEAKEFCSHLTLPGVFWCLEQLDEKWDLVPRLKRRGYDGIIFRTNTEGTTFVAFRPDQIAPLSADKKASGEEWQEDVELEHEKTAFLSPRRIMWMIDPRTSRPIITNAVPGCRTHADWCKQIGIPLSEFDNLQRGHLRVNEDEKRILITTDDWACYGGSRRRKEWAPQAVIDEFKRLFPKSKDYEFYDDVAESSAVKIAARRKPKPVEERYSLVYHDFSGLLANGGWVTKDGRPVAMHDPADSHGQTALDEGLTGYDPSEVDEEGSDYIGQAENDAMALGHLRVDRDYAQLSVQCANINNSRNLIIQVLRMLPFNGDVFLESGPHDYPTWQKNFHSSEEASEWLENL
jgi:GNAT superfamily N-acetyltransferase